jgi:hypothetical protein
MTSVSLSFGFCASAFAAAELQICSVAVRLVHLSDFDGFAEFGTQRACHFDA